MKRCDNFSLASIIAVSRSAALHFPIPPPPIPLQVHFPLLPIFPRKKNFAIPRDYIFLCMQVVARPSLMPGGMPGGGGGIPMGLPPGSLPLGCPAGLMQGLMPAGLQQQLPMPTVLVSQAQVLAGAWNTVPYWPGLVF